MSSPFQQNHDYYCEYSNDDDNNMFEPRPIAPRQEEQMSQTAATTIPKQ